MRSAFVVISFLLVVALGFQMFDIYRVKGATFGWTQSDWSGGGDVGTEATHTDNQTDWTKFASKDAAVDTGSVPGEVRIASTPGSVIQTTDGDFNAGTITNTQINGTGEGANIGLEQLPIAGSGKRWSEMQNFPSEVGDNSSLVFVGSDSVFAFKGYNGSTDFLRYSVSTDVWADMAPAPGGINSGGSLVYPGSGDFVYALRGGSSAVFYRYSISGNSWTTMTAAPGSVGSGGSLVYPGSGDFIYALRGNNATDFYRYSISGNSWTTMTAAPGSVGSGGSLVYPGSGNFIYALRGNNATDFYRYSISGNSWTTMTAAPGSVGSGGSLVYPGSGDYLYASRGNWSSSFYQYSISGNSWTTLSNFPSSMPAGSSLVSPGSGDSIYVQAYRTFYRYSISGNNFVSLTAMPGGPVSYGGTLTAVGSGDLFGFRGNGSRDFFRYSFSANSWLVMASAPGTINSGASLVYPGSGDYIYGFSGGGNSFYRYSISGNSWATMTSAPAGIGNGGSLVYPGSGDYIYGFSGGGNSFYRYSISGNSWATMTSAPAGIGDGGSLVYPGSGNYIYAFRGGATTDFYRYSISGNSWTSMASAPGSVSYGGSLVYPGSGNYIYAFRGGATTDFYRYSISGNSWTTTPSAPKNISYGGSLVYPGSGNYLYAFDGGGNSKSLFRYLVSESASPDIWEYMTPAPGNIIGGGAQVRPGSGDFIYALGGGTSFYRYSLAGNSWATLTPVPASVSYGGSLVYPGSGDYLYAFRGGGAATFYRYSISGNAWTTMTSAPGTISYGGSLVYPGSGDYFYAFAGNGSTDFYRYSISGNAWTTMTSAPGGVSDGASLIYPGSGDFLYALRGNNATDFYRYSISGNAWTARASAPDGIGSGGSLVYPGSGDYVYASRGNGSSFFYRYSVAGNSWVTLTSAPGMIGFGGSIVSDGSYVYGMAGGGSNIFLRYRIDLDLSGSWSTMTPTSFTSSYGSSLTYPGSGDYLYLFQGGSDFYRYSISGGSWSKVTSSLPGISLATSPGSGEYLYALQGSNSPSFYRYSVSGNSWTTMTSAPDNIGSSGAIVSAGSSGYVYAFQGNYSSSFYRYSVSGNSWTTMASAPGSIHGGSLVYPGSGDYIYALRGDGTSFFYRYSISGNSWMTMTSFPGSNYYGSSLAYPGSGDYLYAFQGSSTSFYRYSISTDSWIASAPSPGTVGSGCSLAFAGNQLYGLRGGSTSDFYRYSPSSYVSSGNFLSSVQDIGLISNLDTVSFGGTLNGQTVTMDVRAGNTSTPDGAWSDWLTGLPSGGNISSLTGKRYVQYRANLSTSNSGATPVIDGVTVGYTNHPTNQTLVSSVYDTTDAANVLSKIRWTKNTPANTAVSFQVRTSPDAASWTSWEGPDGTSASSFTDFSGGETMPGNFRSVGSNRYLQYKVLLTTDGSATPTLSDVSVTYVVNAPPQVRNIGASQTLGSGIVAVSYEVKDPDTDTGTLHGRVDMSFEYCVSGCSDSGGEVWSPMMTVSGDIGRVDVDQDAFTGYHVSWDAKTDLDGHYDSYMKIRVTADDGDAANNVFRAVSDPFTLDTKAPTDVSFTIDRTRETDQLSLTTPSDDFPYRMTFSNYSDFRDNPAYLDFSESHTYTDFTEDPATVYLRVRDAYGNYADASATTPMGLQNLVYYDLSTPVAEPARYGEFISWDTLPSAQSGIGGFSEYAVYRADRPDGEPDYELTFAKVASIDDRTLNYYFDTGLDPSRHYSYKVLAVDTLGNSPEFSSVVEDTPNGQGGSDQTQPTVTDVSVSGIGTTSATVTWTTDELSDSSVGYSVDTSYGSERGIASMVTAHRATIFGLTPDTTYHFRVKSRDANGNLAQNDEDNPGLNEIGDFSFATLPGPAISNVEVPSVTNTGATVTWETTTDSSTLVRYSTLVSGGSLVAPTEIGAPDLVGGSAPYLHSLAVQGLAFGTAYHFEVKSVDASGNVAIDNNGGEFYSFTTAADLTPPVIVPDTDNPIVVNDTRAALHFTTSEPAVGRVGYRKSSGDTIVYTDWTTNANIDHFFVLSNLDKRTEYRYFLEARDVNGNETRGEPLTFSTTETQGHPDLSGAGNPQALQVSDTEAVIVIPILNTEAVSVLCYGTSTVSDTDSCDKRLTFDDASRSNFYHLSGLAPNTVYHIRARVTDSLDDSIVFTTDDTTFRTEKPQVDRHDPLTTVSAPTDDDLSIYPDSAFVSWESDQPTNTYIGCSTDPEGPYDDVYVVNASDYDRHHTTKLVNLLSDTVYHCRITATDDIVPATTVSSDVFSFTTEKETRFDHGPLTEISDIEVPEGNLSDSNAVAVFRTDQPALCLAELTVSRGSYANPIVVEEDGYEQEEGYSTVHTLRFVGLIFSTPYYFRVTCHDNLTGDDGSFVNVVSSPEQSFVTKEKSYPESEIGKMGDRVAPSISNVKISDIFGESAVVSWDTDEKSNSNVRYGIVNSDENMSGNPTTNESTEAFATKHLVTVSGLVPATRYRFKATSTDASGNIAISAESAFTTASPSSISSIKAESNALGEATITWKTGIPTTSVVEYGTNETYDERKESSVLTKEHNIELSGLNLGKVYHFRVRGKDKDGAFHVSSDGTFQPKSPPKITEVSIDDVTEHEATVRFVTNVPTDANIIYSDAKRKDDSGYQGKPDLLSRHEISIRNLAPGTRYLTRIQVRDEQGTESTMDGPEFDTGVDEAPPVIGKVKTESALSQSDRVQAIISWATDEPTISNVTYRERNLGEEKEYTVSGGLSTAHTAVITSFRPGTVYDFRIRAVDTSGNETVTKDYALMTPKITRNIIQVIIENFQDIFGWTRAKV